MTRYILSLIAYIPFYLLAMLVAPILPLFAELRNGPIDNANGDGVEPRLPRWLLWFDTSTDNSLWGDHGWRTKHCPNHWDSYLGMVLWLWRNPAAGFCWSVLARPVNPLDSFITTTTGAGLAISTEGPYGSYTIRCSNGAFQYRLMKQLPFGLLLKCEFGWLLDVYVKDPANAFLERPLATFQFQPQIKTA